MYVLYAATVDPSLANSAGWIVCVSVHVKVVAVPPRAVAMSASPNGNGTSTESPCPPSARGAQFGPTVKFPGNGEGGVFLIAKYVCPDDAYGIAVTFSTPISRALAPAALMESMT